MHSCELDLASISWDFMNDVRELKASLIRVEVSWDCQVKEAENNTLHPKIKP